MCGPTKASPERCITSSAAVGVLAPRKGNSSQQLFVWPLPPLAVLLLAPLLPWINRGYTQWFHKLVLAWILTQSPWLVQFLALQGTSVTVGWYVALLYDCYCSNGPFGRILYHNMPEIMAQHMVVSTSNKGGNLLYTPMGIVMMIASHVLDAIGHPLLAYYFIRKHLQNGGTWNTLLTWPMIGSTYLLSRVWSFVHIYYNFGTFGLFYVGYDVYHLSDLDSWIPAYVAEGVLYALIVGWKLTSERSSVNSGNLNQG